MPTIYHVPGPVYRSGDDLVCWDTLAEAGLVTAEDWQWERDEDGPTYVDTDVVCMYETRDEAVEHIAMFRPGATTILRIDLPDSAHITYVAELFPAVISRIPAEYITAETI